jgi:3-oxoacyl-[acyl-carrier protein] reductase
MLTDKIALVTGATRGIGRAIALELGRQGATVIGTATSDDGAGKISAYLSEAGIKGKGVVLNVTDVAQTDGDLVRSCQGIRRHRHPGQ